MPPKFPMLLSRRILRTKRPGATKPSLLPRPAAPSCGAAQAARPEDGTHAPELAATTLRALKSPEIAACRARLVPEITVFSALADHDSTTYVGGVADAIAYQPIGLIDLVVDWKTDINPGAQ